MPPDFITFNRNQIFAIQIYHVGSLTSQASVLSYTPTCTCYIQIKHSAHDTYIITILLSLPRSNMGFQGALQWSVLSHSLHELITERLIIFAFFITTRAFLCFLHHHRWSRTTILEDTCYLLTTSRLGLAHLSLDFSPTLQCAIIYSNSPISIFSCFTSELLCGSSSSSCWCTLIIYRDGAMGIQMGKLRNILVYVFYTSLVSVCTLPHYFVHSYGFYLLPRVPIYHYYSIQLVFICVVYCILCYIE